MLTWSLTCLGLIALVLTAGQDTALASWKTDMAKKTVGRAAREGIEQSAKNTAVDVALDAAVPGGSALGDATRGKRDRGTTFGTTGSDVSRPGDGRAAIGGAAGEGLEAAMTAANVASTVNAAADAADAAQRLNKVRKVVR